jgi:carbon-monoxide dehydrogenase medium subunit
MLPEFEMLTPGTLQDALQLLSKRQPGIMPVAGGTNLTVDLRGGRHQPLIILNIDSLEELRGIKEKNGHLVIGAGTCLAEILKDPQIHRVAPALRLAASLFANPLIRNRATLGGNLADGSPAADSAPPLLALGAEVTLKSQSNERTIPLDKFFIHVRKTALAPDELITSVSIPLPEKQPGMGYYKLGLRKADAISVISVAVILATTSEGKCEKARIALGSVAPTPIRSHTAEDFLAGKICDQQTLERAALIASDDSSPISDLRASGDYRRRMVTVLVRRALEQALNGNRKE